MITRQSTARTILVGPVLDSTGAAKTDEVVGSIKITKNGVVGAADGSATLTHDHAGKYKLALTANDCDTVGVLEISLNSGTNDMPVKGLNVVETAIWDALFADGATGFASIADQTAIKAKTDNLPTDPADQSAVEAAITAATSPLATAANLAIVAGYLDTEIAAIKTKTDQLTFTTANKVDSTAVLDSAVETQIDNIENASGYLLAVLAGACADPQTSSETYAITVFGSTFTVDMAGQTSTGTRTAPTLTKT
jgi:hypothetical protein